MTNAQGWLNIYKPQGISSFNVVYKIKKKFNLNKIGHGGTLDPLAEGVLPIAIGKTTKLIPFINKDIKEYEFKVKWCEQTNTDDSEGEVIARSSKIPSSLEINNQISKIKGNILQKPPYASAIKINGKKSYQLLRSKKKFDIKERLVFLDEVRLLSSQKQTSKFFIRCGKGFYIRSFARDLGEKLATKAHISYLKRIKVGKFEAKNANLLDDLLNIRQRLFEFKGFHSSSCMLDDILAYEVDDEKDITSISQGKSIKLNLKKLIKTPLDLTEEKIIFLTVRKKVISFGKLSGDLFKPNKVLL